MAVWMSLGYSSVSIVVLKSVFTSLRLDVDLKLCTSACSNSRMMSPISSSLVIFSFALIRSLASTSTNSSWSRPGSCSRPQ